jgi:hypothetical protein
VLIAEPVAHPQNDIGAGDALMLVEFVALTTAFEIA